MPKFLNTLLAFLNRFFQINVGVHTEYAGTGRVRFINFFRGAGYCVVLKRGRGRDGKPLTAPGLRLNIAIRGFTFFWRVHKSTFPRPGRVEHFRLTTNLNRPIC